MQQGPDVITLISPTIDPTKCQEIEASPNGYLAPESSYAVGGQLVFECDECYEIVGESTLTCLDTLIWEGEPGYCEEQSMYQKQFRMSLRKETFRCKVV